MVEQAPRDDNQRIQDSQRFDENQRFDDVQRLNGRLDGLPYKLALVNPSEIHRAKKNARFMKAETFNRLVANIQRDGGLASVPFCIKKDDGFHVLSGNHRVMAAEKAGLTQILVLYTDRKMNRSQEVAAQLSHNAVVGQDEPVVLAELWEEIETISEKLYAGLDDQLLGILQKAESKALSPINLDYRIVSFAFLPAEVETMQRSFALALQQATAAESIHLCRFKDFDRLIAAMAKVKDSQNILNSALALSTVLDWFEKQQIPTAAESKQRSAAEADAKQSDAKLSVSNHSVVKTTRA